MRIQRALARAGIASRRAADALVGAGRVTVNGTVAITGQTVDPARDDIRVDGKRLAAPQTTRWFVLNKPAGVTTTRSDERGRPTVFSLVPDVPGLTYVGRLDLLTEGVLLLTTDGIAAHRLSHPSGEVTRTYVATVRGSAREAAERARAGVELDDGTVRAEDVDVTPAGRGAWNFSVTIREGRKREVRRLCEALGLEVVRLVRTAYGPITLGTLKPGEWRELSLNEVERLLPPPRGAGRSGP